MDIDNIKDIEIIKLALKKERAKMKQDVTDEDNNFVFKTGHWYKVVLDEDGIMIFADNSDASYWFSWDEEEKYLMAYDE